MARKVDVPNNLGPFLTLKNISNIEIYAKTGIPTSELSQLRNGDIKKIAADKLFLMAKVREIDMGETLKGVYPTLKLKSVPTKLTKPEFDNIKDFFNYIEGDVIQEIAEKTGLTPYRIRNIKRGKVKPAAHELYSIEMATKTKPGTLFIISYKHLKLNSPEKEAQLRLEEKARSSKK